MVLVIGQIKLGNLWRSHSEVLNLIISHLHRYPKMEVQDAYKLLYQGTIGPELEVDDEKLVETKLREEFTSVPPSESIPLWENLRQDGEIVRLNMAPFKTRGGDVNSLLTMCSWTASSFKGSPVDLAASWETFKHLCQDGRLPKFDPELLEKFDLWLSRHDFPPLHHSDQYNETYQPAYKLIRREFLNLISPVK